MRFMSEYNQLACIYEQIGAQIVSVYHVLYDVQSNVWNDFHIICLSYYALSEAKKSLSPPIHSPIAWVGST